MESIPFNPILEYNPDTLFFIRKQYDLDKLERIEEAITILKDWLQKQDHIVKKNYSSNYLERVIILSKGSVERAKAKLDKIATFRTLLPQYFEPIDNLKKTLLNDLITGIPSKLTPDHYRVVITDHKIKQADSGLMDFYRYLIMVAEYIQCNDYLNGVEVILDYRNSNLLEIIKALNLVEIQQIFSIIMEGYGMRIKGIHFITTSKAIDTVVYLFKSALNKKVAERIHVHNNVDTLHKHIPKDILPSDYGGQAKSLLELSHDLKAELNSENYLKHYKEMQKACTNENYRRDDKFNEQCVGIPGSFRQLSVD
ncbi:alpha-tocopherol transfer protein-like [Bicyclus anynana]|uniref:Alpha-tocopherol transfer protein-like n=1 Tax=Bicyclus anynana TaxID=110368 RepID=A0A6J1NKA9_BICAN|nr:alpha-tocopherol transfer protein-like [Bicyclus anynana]